MTVAVHVIYRVDRSLVSAFAPVFDAEGLALGWHWPAEQVGVGEISLALVAPTVGGFAIDEILASVRAAIASFTERFPTPAP